MVLCFAKGSSSPRDRFKEALWVNAKFYIIVGAVGGVAGVLLLHISKLWVIWTFFGVFISHVVGIFIVSFLL